MLAKILEGSSPTFGSFSEKFFRVWKPGVTSTIFPNISVTSWRHSVSCSSALPEACRLTCPLVRPWRDHRLLHADSQTEVNNTSLQWRQQCDKITETDFMGLPTWDCILWNQKECLSNLRPCCSVDQDAKLLGVAPSRLVNNCRHFGEQCCLLFMV
jgi:hypothetical protein